MSLTKDSSQPTRRSLEKFRVFTDLLAALDLGFGNVLDQHRIELAAVAANDARAVAQEFVRTRRREQEDLGARQVVLPAVVQVADHLRHFIAHNGVFAVMRPQVRDVDAHQAKQHGRVLDLAVLPHEGFEAAECGDIGIAAGIDGQLGADFCPALLGPCQHAADLLGFGQHINDRSVKKDLNAGLGKEVVAGFAPNQWIMRQRVGVAVALRLGDPALGLHHLDEAVGKTKHHLFGRLCRAFGRGIETAHRSRETGNGGAAAEAVLL